MPLLVLAPPAYRIVDLGLPSDPSKVETVAINNRGEVLLRGRVDVSVSWFGSNGTSGVSTESVDQGYLWRAGRFLTIALPRAEPSFDMPGVQPQALNDRSVVVGSSGTGMPLFMSGLTESVACVWRGRAVERLGADGPSVALSLNNLGDVVGSVGHGGFARLKGRIVGLPEASHVEPRDPSGELQDVNQSSGVAINDRRLILMSSTYGGKRGDADLPTHPFLVDGNARRLRMVPVPLPRGFRNAQARDLNASGTVLAVAYDPSRPRTVPYLASDRRITPLALPGSGLALGAADLNDRGDVVGTVYPSMHLEATRPVWWRAGRATPFPTFPGWTLQTATGINDAGAICGDGLHEGKPRAYLLVPLSAPGGSAPR